MYVKKIRLVGFKSFAEETIIPLEKGITAIVGPNGCGKSNIVDAVRWALGEKSSRALRGKSMEDVIFLGSEKRKPLGMAEVELYFDNTDKTLKVETEEVVVSRRIFLNSSSEYYLNGKKTTRKEIDLIFMDTGIGKTAYSIIEQGKIDEILKASPEERRNIFDEAAGISRFKVEKTETLKKLEDATQNLLRLQDILNEKEKELHILEKQSRKTKQYLSLKERLDTHDLRLRYLKYTGYLEKRKVIGEKLKTLLDEKNRIFQQIGTHDSEIEELEKRNHEEIERLQYLEIEFHKIDARIQQKKQEIRNIMEEEKNIRSKLEQIEQRTSHEQKYLKNIEKKFQESLQMELDLGNEIESVKKSMESKEQQIRKLQQELEVSKEKEASTLKEIEKLDEEYGILLESFKNITESLLKDLQTRIEEFKLDEEKRKVLQNKIQDALHHLQKQIDGIREVLKSRNFEKLEELLRQLNVQDIYSTFLSYISIEEKFREVFFGKHGVISRKEEIDEKMKNIYHRKQQLQSEIKELRSRQANLISELEKLNTQKNQMELLLRDYEVRKNSSAETRDTMEEQIKETRERLNFLKEEKDNYLHLLEQLKIRKEQYQKEIKELEEELQKFHSESKELKNRTKEGKEKIQELRKLVQKHREKIEALLPEITSYERQEENIKVAMHTLEEELYHDFQMSPAELLQKFENHNFVYEKELMEYQRLKSEIQALGQFNALAIEQYEFAKKAYEELLKQKEDVENAKKNIKEILRQIDEKTTSLFLETFEKIQKNFDQVFKTLFGGGNAQLTLTDPSQPLECGVQIMAQPPGKKNTNISLLSGGEQSLTAIALMFAIYLVKPAPFCILDEIDAPLDDNNVKRFLRLLKEFSRYSQFLVITHNKLTMMEADVIFGVTQEEPGVSRIVSVKLENFKKANVN